MKSCLPSYTHLKIKGFTSHPAELTTSFPPHSPRVSQHKVGLPSTTLFLHLAFLKSCDSLLRQWLLKASDSYGKQSSALVCCINLAWAEAVLGGFLLTLSFQEAMHVGTGYMPYNSPPWDWGLVGLMLLPPFQVPVRYPDRGRRQVFTKCYIDASLGPVDGTSFELVSFIAIAYFVPTHPRLSIVILLQFYAIGMRFSLRRGTRTMPI